MLQHAKDLADMDPNCPLTRRVIEKLVCADCKRNNRGDTGARLPAKAGRDPYDCPSDTSTDSASARFGSPGLAAGSARSPASPPLDLVSINACGPSRAHKLAALVSHMRNAGADVIAV